jgi:hypothetical protein
MCVDVLSPAWEVRHGAAVALREVLRSHAGSAGVDAAILAEPSGVLLLFLSLCILCATPRETLEKSYESKKASTLLHASSMSASQVA